MSAAPTAGRPRLPGAAAVFARVANQEMKLGSLGPVSYTRNGVNVDVSSGAVKLTL